MKKTNKFLSFLNSLLTLIITAVIALALINVYNFYKIKKEYTITETRISQIPKKIKQLEKEINTIYKQSSSLKKKQLKVIETNKGQIEKSIALSNENMLLAQQIDELMNNEPYILIDTKENTLYFKRKTQIIKQAKCSVGKGGILTDTKTGRKWEFVTPRGIFTIISKTVNPIWCKPDWAFIEEKKAIPLPGAQERNVLGELGQYALDLGFGYKIHGTSSEDMLGRPVSHGCIRLGAADLQYIYNRAKINKTPVYVY